MLYSRILALTASHCLLWSFKVLLFNFIPLYTATKILGRNYTVVEQVPFITVIPYLLKVFLDENLNFAKFSFLLFCY